MFRKLFKNVRFNSLAVVFLFRVKYTGMMNVFISCTIVFKKRVEKNKIEKYYVAFRYRVCTYEKK